jgi:hypothetical protein
MSAKEAPLILIRIYSAWRTLALLTDGRTASSYFSASQILYNFSSIQAKWIQVCEQQLLILMLHLGYKFY